MSSSCLSSLWSRKQWFLNSRPCKAWNLSPTATWARPSKSASRSSARTSTGSPHSPQSKGSVGVLSPPVALRLQLLQRTSIGFTATSFSSAELVKSTRPTASGRTFVGRRRSCLGTSCHQMLCSIGMLESKRAWKAVSCIYVRMFHAM